MSLLAVIEKEKKEVDSVMEEIKIAEEGSYIHSLNKRVAHLIWEKKINRNNGSSKEDWNYAQKKINEFVVRKFQTYGESFELVLKRYTNSIAHYYYISKNRSYSLEECKRDAINDIALIALL